MAPESKNETINVLNDHDVLCGRGKGPRKHPGNDFYYNLLRENYLEYRSARKGVKASLVKKIVSQVQEKNGRFLERKKIDDSWVYSNIGEERALLKTAQAIRDVKTTTYSSIDKSRSQHQPKAKPKPRAKPKPKPKEEKKPPPSIVKRSDLPRRPTYQERLAMLERERIANQASSSDESTDESEDESESEDEEEEVSDTETEGSDSTKGAANNGNLVLHF